MKGFWDWISIQTIIELISFVIAISAVHFAAFYFALPTSLHPMMDAIFQLNISLAFGSYLLISLLLAKCTVVLFEGIRFNVYKISVSMKYRKRKYYRLNCELKQDSDKQVNVLKNSAFYIPSRNLDRIYYFINTSFSNHSAPIKADRTIYRSMYILFPASFMFMYVGKAAIVVVLVLTLFTILFWTYYRLVWKSYPDGNSAGNSDVSSSCDRDKSTDKLLLSVVVSVSLLASSLLGYYRVEHLKTTKPVQILSVDEAFYASLISTTKLGVISYDCQTNSFSFTDYSTIKRISEATNSIACPE